MSLDPHSFPALSDTVSEQARSFLQVLIQAGQKNMVAPLPDDTEAWQTLYTQAENMLLELAAPLVKANKVSMQDTLLGGTPVVKLTPEDCDLQAPPVIYLHGGAFTLLSARSTAGLGSALARATRRRLLAIDYTPAPRANWKTIHHEIHRAYEALINQGVPLHRIATIGDSAGGNLALSAVLNLRDAGLGQCGPVALLSPWADLANRGDTALTLAHADPTLSYDNLLHNSALAYTQDLNLNDARVSPLFADFTRGFPPTLIQDGTRTILLSTSVRLYQALDAAGQNVTLDLYEGMWHVFQGGPYPESERALAKIAAFLDTHAT
ncbi:MAG: alpha/beta hydrolase [Alcaligenaceae bacterium]|nr:alpha/beta hydrolase [Alcaligenaceae bacterium]